MITLAFVKRRATSALLHGVPGVADFLLIEFLNLCFGMLGGGLQPERDSAASLASH
jgi:hypothetical protein